MTKSNTAQASKHSPTPGPEHRRLDVFIGKWNMEGRQYDGPVGQAAKIDSAEKPPLSKNSGHQK